MIFKKFFFVFIFIASCVVGNKLLAQSHRDVKPAIKKISDELANSLQVERRKKIAVANFIDLQGNPTELGRYLSQQISVNLIRNNMNIVDRSSLAMLMQEFKISDQGLFDPKIQMQLKELSGIEIIIFGVTTPFDSTIDLTLSAIDLSSNKAITAVEGIIPRSDAINALLRSSISNSVPMVGSTAEPSETLIGERTFDLPRSRCIKDSDVYGQVFFNNATNEDLILYDVSGVHSIPTNISIAAGTKSESPLLITSTSNEVNSGVEWMFSFRTREADPNLRRYAKLALEVRGCKMRVTTLSLNRLFSRNKK